MKKKTTLLVVAIVAVLLASVVTVDQYKQNQNNKNKQEQSRVATEKVLTTKVTELEARQKDLIAKYEVVRVNCEKGVNAHAQLPTFIRTKVAQPSCGQAIL